MPKNHNINRERVTVVRENRWLRVWQGLILLLVLVSLPTATWWITRAQLGEDYRALQTQMSALQSESAQMQQRIEELLQQRADLEVAAQLDADTLQQLRERLVDWREANEQLEEQTQFYMSLMNPSANNAGVFVESIEIRATSTPNQYGYDVLVAQRTLNHQRITGRLVIDLQGEQSGQQIILNADSLGLETDGQALGFRYFQHLTGEIFLPEEFEAEQLRARVYLSGSSTPLIDEQVDWPSS